MKDNDGNVIDIQLKTVIFAKKNKRVIKIGDLNLGEFPLLLAFKYLAMKFPPCERQRLLLKKQDQIY